MNKKKETRINIAVLMTCFNRRETTLSCLQTLYRQKDIKNIHIQVYLVDDGSSDGTSDAVRKNFPEITIIQGDGKLFWNGGMRAAWKEALRFTYDYYLWLNDDCTLYPFALQTLFDTVIRLQKTEAHPFIIVGSMRDPVTSEFSYGGKNRRNNWILLPFNNAIPSEIPKFCDTVNGNCVLVPNSVVSKIGILSKEFTHGIGDYDYGLRAKKAGFKSFVAPGYVGNCSNNVQDKTSYNKNISYRKRVLLTSNPTNLPPAREMMIFIRRHGGIFWIFYWFRYLARGYFPQLWFAIRSRKFK